jgi:polyhydroxyalkanoate synthase
MAQQTIADNSFIKVPDPYELFRTVQNLIENSQKVAMHLLTKQATYTTPPVVNPDPLGVGKMFQEVTTKMLLNPTHLIDAQLSLWQEHLKLLQNLTLRNLGYQVEAVATPAKGDRRFKYEGWDNVPWFDFLKQSYLVNARWLNDTVKTIALAEEPDSANAKKIMFYTRQLIDALAPSNFVPTNPEVLYATLKSNGENLLNGLNNLLEDLERGKGTLSIKMSDLKAFKLGENIAATPGKVIFQNDLMQLLQYQPSTEQVHLKPLLVVPPWINKYYILDLSPANSFIKWAVDQGHTVFLMSWVNPDERLAHKIFDDYLLEGPLAALDVIEKITGQREVNAVGYCLGGTLLAITVAYLAAKKDDRILSGTYFTTMLDFSEPGELGVFLDEEQISLLEEKMKEKGYLDGSSMATTFNMLRANDLIWSFYVNNYLLGNEATAFDLLYWNSDSTRMPAKMHSFYLRNMYQQNLLTQPNGISLNGQGIDLSLINTPGYFVSTQEDHISPWKSTYKGVHLLSGPVKFILGGSGHIAGIINPPTKNKYFYYTNNKAKTTKNPDSWLSAAKTMQGSWWNDWAKWVSGYAGEKIPARIPGTGPYPALEDAPGSYVKESVLNNS